MAECPTCKAKLGKFLDPIYTLKDKATEIVSEFTGQQGPFCTNCQAYNSTLTSLKVEKGSLEKKMNKALELVPILSVQNPHGWQYDCIEMVTGQSVTGTGAISEFTSAFTDFFGQQSGRYNDKIRMGEKICKAQLAAQAIELGANAVIAADIDYAELGGGKAMIMVCMTGTAVKLNNLKEVLNEERHILSNVGVDYKRVTVLETQIKTLVSQINK